LHFNSNQEQEADPSSQGKHGSYRQGMDVGPVGDLHASASTQETMRPSPHHYSVTSQAAPNLHVRLNSVGLSELSSEPPAEFGGPGNLWSPETLLLAAVADCF